MPSDSQVRIPITVFPCVYNDGQNLPTPPKSPAKKEERDAFHAAGMVHLAYAKVTENFISTSHKDNKTIALYEKDWRDGAGFREYTRKFLREKIDKLAPNEKNHFIVKAHSSNIKDWEAKEKAINAIFIKWHMDTRQFNGKPL